MRAVISQLNLLARAYHCISKLARMIANLVGSEIIQSTHLAETLHALQLSEVDDAKKCFISFGSVIPDTDFRSRLKVVRSIRCAIVFVILHMYEPHWRGHRSRHRRAWRDSISPH